MYKPVMMLLSTISDDEASNHEDASDTGAAPKQQQHMEHYLEYIDNEVWKKAIQAVELKRKRRRGLRLAKWSIWYRLKDLSDIVEMDIDWQIAMIAIRNEKFYKKTGRMSCVDGIEHCLTAKGDTSEEKKDRRFLIMLYTKEELSGRRNQLGLVLVTNGCDRVVSTGEEHTEMKRYIMHLWLQLQ
ncbi:hypothetical protein Tco_1167036 [Tanacetum coccineum]